MAKPDSDTTTSPPNASHASKRWKARLTVSLTMLTLALVSLIIMGLHRAYWIFTYLMAGADALLCIWLVWYVKRNDGSRFPGNLWHMVLHWVGLAVVLYLIGLCINRGVISPTEAGLFSLLVLALTLYLAGIYTDTTFVLVGLVLALMAAGTVLIKPYLWMVMVPIIVIVGLLIFLMITRDRAQSAGN